MEKNSNWKRTDPFTTLLVQPDVVPLVSSGLFVISFILVLVTSCRLLWLLYEQSVSFVPLRVDLVNFKCHGYRIHMQTVDLKIVPRVGYSFSMFLAAVSLWLICDSSHVLSEKWLWFIKEKYSRPHRDFNCLFIKPTFLNRKCNLEYKKREYFPISVNLGFVLKVCFALLYFTLLHSSWKSTSCWFS